MKENTQFSAQDTENLILMATKMSDYIFLLIEEINEIAPIAHIHGWRCNSERRKAGEALRREIFKVGSKINIPANIQHKLAKAAKE
jgi:hypothetical protein